MSKYFIQTVGKGKGTIVKLQKDEGTRVNLIILKYDKKKKKLFLIFPYFVSKINFDNYYEPITFEAITNLKNKSSKKKKHKKIHY